MTLDQLVILDAIASTGSFRAAAESLHRTQPTLSVAMRNLEEEFGFQVFDRSQYRPKLTPKGERIWQQARRVLAQAEQLESMSQILATEVEAELFVVFDALCPLPLVLDFLAFFERQFPHTRLQLSFEYVSGALERLLDGTSHIALGPLPEEVAELERVKLFDVRMVPVAAPALWETLPKPLTLEALENTIQVVVRDSRLRGERRSIGVLERGRRWTVSDLSLKLEMLKRGIGWGRMPEFWVKEALEGGALVKLPEDVCPLLTNSVYLLRRFHRERGPVAQAVWEYFRTAET
jgi:DNA-binding transcriptional LysR family regulator